MLLNYNTERNFFIFADMKRLLLFALLSLAACTGKSLEPDASWHELLDKSDQAAAAQQWEDATALALQALDAKDIEKGGKSLVLSHLAAIDMATWRDSQGWEHAIEAESLAREEGIDSLLSLALLQKGKLLLFGAITEGEAQDAEALECLQEAMLTSGENIPLKAEILLQQSQAFIGLNRFNDPIDEELYAKAGECLRKAEDLAGPSAGMIS